MSVDRVRFGANVGVVLVALAVLSSVFAPAVAIPQPSGTVGMAQTADESTVVPGGTVTIEATINATGYNAPAMAVDLPDGWSIQSQSAEGPATYKSSTNEWVWLSGGEYTVEYTVNVPDDASAGDYAIENEGSAIDPADDSRVTNTVTTSLTVGEPEENLAPTADAGPDQTVTEGEQVTLDGSGSVDPDGDDLTYTWMQIPVETVSLSDPSAIQPTFTAPEVDGTQVLTFQLQVSDGQTTDTDEVQVTVQDADEPPAPSDGITVTQATPSGATAVAGGTVSFETTVDPTGLNAPALQVTLPDGWSIQSQSAEGPATYKPSTNEWVWTAGDVQESYTVSYTVAVPEDAEEGPYTVTAVASAIDPDQDDELVTDEDQTIVSVLTEPAGDGPATSVHLAPSSQLLAPGQTSTYDVVVADVDGGVGAYELSVGIDEPSVGVITDISPADTTDMTLSDVEIADDGSSATIGAALLDTADDGSVTVAEITVEAVDEGTADVTLAVPTLATENGTKYQLTAIDDATLQVSNLIVGDSSNPALDPDGDGLYEDVNGDGVVDIADIQTLYFARNGPSVTANPLAFDFNGDGEFDIADIQALYAQEVAG